MQYDKPPKHRKRAVTLFLTGFCWLTLAESRVYSRTYVASHRKEATSLQNTGGEGVGVLMSKQRGSLRSCKRRQVAKNPAQKNARLHSSLNECNRAEEFSPAIRPGRTDPSSSPCSTQPQNPAQMSPARRRMHKTPQALSVESSSQKQDRQRCPPTSTSR